MLFNSFIFAGFFVTVLALYRNLNHTRQNWLLLGASYLFYATWDWRFCFLLLLSTLVDFNVGQSLSKAVEQTRRKRLLTLSVMTNLSILGAFKYFNFFVDSAVDMLSAVGLEPSSPTLQIVLPVGISFYTFQTMSYTIDIYRGRLEPTDSLRDFAVFVAYFPQLVAGPIERARNLLPRIAAPRVHDRAVDLEGLWLILWGLFKKVVIADNAAVVANQIFSDSEPASGLVALVGVYAFALQIYGDFSGYTDIARGTSKLLGIELMRNFDRPYIATSPQDFWLRWHISLSSWLRDYLYIPLGGNRGTKIATYRNLLLTMVIGGLWHGAAWTFVVWGLFHGLALAIHRLLITVRPPNPDPSRLLIGAKVVGTFHLVCFGWLFFRATSFTQAFNFAVAMVSDPTIAPVLGSHLFKVAVLAYALFVIETWVKSRDDPSHAHGWSRGLGPAVVTSLVLATIMFAPPGGQQFIYFQF